MGPIKFTVPDFLSASSPQGLRRLMFQKCIKDGVLYNFTDIQFANGKWIAWFKSDIKDLEKIPVDKKEK